MSRLSVALAEQQALLLLLLSRESAPSAGDRAFSPTHIRRALIAHMAVTQRIAEGPALPQPVSEHLTAALLVLTECIASMQSSDQDPAESRILLLPALASLFAVERAALGAASYRLDSESLEHIGAVAEADFEAFYGYGELAGERRNW